MNCYERGEAQRLYNKTVGIIGTGTMGVQITECFIENGYRVILKTRDLSSKDRIMQTINRHLLKMGDKSYADNALSHLSITDSFDCLTACSIIIESVVEDYQIKCEILRKIKNIVSDRSIIVTNTSALSVNRLSEELPGLTGFHFFNPASRMRLIEIVPSKTTQPSTIELLKRVTESLGKQPIVVTDSPGFLVNKLLLPQINNAIKMHEAGIASKEDIDSAMRLGLNHSMGPFELADFIGLDVCYYILEEMYEVSDDLNYRPASLLKELISRNRLGMKSGSGFYDYPRV